MATSPPTVIEENETTNYYLRQQDTEIDKLKGVATLTDIKIIDEKGLKVKKERIKNVKKFKTDLTKNISGPPSKTICFIPYEETLTYMVDYQDVNEYRFSYVIYQVHERRDANKYQKIDMKKYIMQFNSGLEYNPSNLSINYGTDHTEQFADIMEGKMGEHFEQFYNSFENVLENVVDKDKDYSYEKKNDNGDICKKYRTKGSFDKHDNGDYVYTLFRKKEAPSSTLTETYEYLQAEFKKNGDKYDFTFKFVPADFT